MRFLVVSDAPVLLKNGEYTSYAPYVKELNLWFKYADQVTILAPTRYYKPLLTAPFDRQDLTIKSLKRLEFNTVFHAVVSFLLIPYQFVALCFAFAKADHIHLRCPGNLALLACIAQVFFPSKTKTVKYAGNWDPKATQPLAYRWQKNILSNTRWTKNMKVLVYGNWPDQSENIKPFFTASYHDVDKETILEREYSGKLSALFVGTLSSNKRPLEVVQIISELRNVGIDIYLDIYGDGDLREMILNSINKLQLNDYVNLHGNQSLETVTQSYKKSHFAFLLSKSEGWPKAVAEPMFYGCIPIATTVSCVPWMLGANTSEPRGILINDISECSHVIIDYLSQNNELIKMSKHASEWSREYTFNRFEAAIKKLL